MKRISVIAILTAFMASSAQAEYVNFTVTPLSTKGEGQRVVTQIRIEPICGCGATCAPAGEAEAPAPEEPKPDKPRKSQAAKKPSCDCKAITAKRDTARTKLVACEKVRDKCAADLAAVGERITAAEAEIAKLKEQTVPTPPPAADKPQGRAPVRSRGRTTAGGAIGGAAGTGEDLTPFTTRSRGAGSGN